MQTSIWYLYQDSCKADFAKRKAAIKKRRGPNQRSDVPFTQVVSPALHAVGFGAKLQLGSISIGVSSYHVNKAIKCRLA